jgi:Predicted flavoprotein involved in K+ transport
VIDEYKIKEKIHFQHRVVSANYDSQTRKWSVVIEDAKKKQQTWVANFVFGCTVIIIMTKVSNLSLKGRKTLKVPSFIHNIGLKILIMQAKKW